jgi:DNA-binding XRE family transcriptional regulator
MEGQESPIRRQGDCILRIFIVLSYKIYTLYLWKSQKSAQVISWAQQDLKGRSYPEHLGHQVRYFRRMRRWSQASLAASANLRQATIVAIESGQGNPTLRTIEQIAMALDVHLLELLT